MRLTRARKIIQRFKPRKLPAPADYTDEVTDEHLKQIKKLVDQDQFEDAEEVSGPGW